VDTTERNSLFEKFAPLATKISKSFPLPGTEPDDVEQIAAIAIITALDAKPEIAKMPVAEANVYISSCIRNSLRDQLNHIKVDAHYSSISLSDPVGAEDSTTTIGDLIASDEPSPEELAIASDMLDRIQPRIDQLDAFEKKIIELRFGFETGVATSLRQIAVLLQTTSDKVERHFRATIALLAKSLEQPQVALQGAK
jgi:RNA polymerase sigma factor (sigma-70 family)